MAKFTKGMKDQSPRMGSTSRGSSPRTKIAEQPAVTKRKLRNSR
jgi:hypothetical protein